MLFKILNNFSVCFNVQLYCLISNGKYFEDAKLYKNYYMNNSFFSNNNVIIII